MEVTHISTGLTPSSELISADILWQEDRMSGALYHTVTHHGTSNKEEKKIYRHLPAAAH